MRNKASIFFLIISISFICLTQQKQEEKIIKVGIEGDFTTFDPWVIPYSAYARLFWNIYEPLVIMEENSTRIKPHLATSWQVSDQNRIWLFKLREGVKFHDGSALTADDVVASASLFQPFDARAEKIDNLTVRFTLPEPNSGFLNHLANIEYPIAPAQSIQQYKSLQKAGQIEDFTLIGSGPYKFSHWEKSKELVLESFPDYWQGKPWLDKVVLRIIPDNKERITALEKGELDVIDIVLPTDLPRLKKNPRLRIRSKYGMNICYIAMNIQREPLNNIQIRKALNMAVDKMRLTRMFFYGGYGVPTDRILSPAFWGFTALPNAGVYNPEKAKQLLAEAGYQEGLSLKFVNIPYARPYVPDPQGVANEIKKELAAIGINIDILIPANYDELNSILASTEWHLTLTGWIDLTGDPDYTLNYLLSGKLYPYNYSRWQNELFDEKLKAARSLPLGDVSGKIKLYNEAQQIFQNEVPWIPLVHTKNFLIYNRKIKGIKFYPNTMISYHKIKFE
jgi:peptide/nickel transport system substrate-binding protein